MMTAWEQRDKNLLPGVQELGPRASAATRTGWGQALDSDPARPVKDANEALLRLEMAAELPTPAEDLAARRNLQLQLLTRRNEPGPAQTWAQDAATLLATPYEPTKARRVQSVLKVLLKK